MEKLQWGRERALAEMGGTGGNLSVAAALQWGRERALAEMQVLPIAAPRARSASMGPRARARGNIVVAIRRDVRDGFNGAASARSRKSRNRQRSLHSQRSFNGAASARSRK